MLHATVLLTALAVLAGQPKASFPEKAFDFGKAIRGKVLAHEFKLRNEGDVPLRIAKISMTAPLVATGFPKEIAPGREAGISLKLDTSLLRGLFEGTVVVFLNDPDLPQARLAFTGRVISTVEVAPRPAFFIGAVRGQVRQASLEIINHESEPLRIEGIEHSTARFTTRLEALEEGQRYRLTLVLKPDGPGGRHSEPILVRTSSRNFPRLTIAANTYLRERVYAFPDEVDLGALPLSQFRKNPAALKSLTQTLAVHQAGGSDFRLKARSTVPSLVVTTERGEQGDRYEIKVSLAGEGLRPGPIRGSIVIETNDREFPKLTIPVSGYLLE